MTQSTTESILAPGNAVTFRGRDGHTVTAEVTAARHGQSDRGRATHAVTVSTDSRDALAELAELVEADLITVADRDHQARLRVTGTNPSDAGAGTTDASKLILGISLESIRTD